MDPFNATIMELIAAETERTRRVDLAPHLVETMDAARRGDSGLRPALARAIVRLGLRLHPAAGDGLPAHSMEARS